MQELRQSTSITHRIGPFVDSDGIPATGLSIAQADIRLSKNGADFAQSNDSGGGTHDEYGWYYITLDATDTGTLGRLTLAVYETGAIPVFHEFMVVNQQYWDSKYSSDKLQVHVDEITAGLITAAAIATGAIDADAIADNAIDAGAIAAAAGNKLADHVWRRAAASIENSSDGDTYDPQSPYGMVAFFINLVDPSGSDIDVYEADGVTVFYSRTLTTDSGADPTTGMSAAT